MTEKTEKHPGGAHPGSQADIPRGPGGCVSERGQYRQGYREKGCQPVRSCVEHRFRFLCLNLCADVSGAAGRVNRCRVYDVRRFGVRVYLGYQVFFRFFEIQRG
jgi:hypothetical protein